MESVMYFVFVVCSAFPLNFTADLPDADEQIVSCERSRYWENSRADVGSGWQWHVAVIATLLRR